MSDKLLLHDIDVTLQLVDGIDTIYGNNIINDEINNVEQVLVNSPVVGTYKVTITSKTFSENNGFQKASIVLTSGGYVASRTLTSVTAAGTAICPIGEQSVTINLLDRGGDGWPTGTSYELRNVVSNVVWKTGSLGNAPSQDFNVPVTFCLPTSAVYTVSLLLPGDDDVGEAMDVGLEITQCKVYLSYYQTNATLDLNTDPAACNPCGTNDAAVSMYFADSPLLDHYGWNRNSTYSLSTIRDGDFMDFDNEVFQLTGTLLYGYVGWVEQCLHPGSYR